MRVALSDKTYHPRRLRNFAIRTTTPGRTCCRTEERGRVYRGARPLLTRRATARVRLGGRPRPASPMDWARHPAVLGPCEACL